MKTTLKEILVQNQVNGLKIDYSAIPFYTFIKSSSVDTGNVGASDATESTLSGKSSRDFTRALTDCRDSEREINKIGSKPFYHIGVKFSCKNAK